MESRFAFKSLLHPESLVQTLDAVEAATFAGAKVHKAQSREIVVWLLGRMSSPDNPVHGCYRGMPAPTAADFNAGGKVFTGEAVHSRAGLACKFGFEAMRTIVLLDDRRALRHIVRENCDWVHDAQSLYKRIGRPIGTYCCASCSAAMWRLASGGGISKADGLLSSGLRWLKSRRDGEGKWRGFPFYYTLLALSEAQTSAARAELKYAAGVCERLVKRTSGDKYALRRQKLMERVLAQV